MTEGEDVADIANLSFTVVGAMHAPTVICEMFNASSVQNQQKLSLIFGLLNFIDYVKIKVPNKSEYFSFLNSQ